MPTNLTSKGQLTVPKTVRDYLGLKPGAAVTFERLPGGEDVLRPARPGIKSGKSRYVVTDDPQWAEWSQAQLDTASLTDRLAINLVI